MNGKANILTRESENMSGKARNGSALLLFVIAFVTLMDGLDGSIINVALPALAIAMHTDTGTIAWVTVSYFLMIAGLILIFGRIASNGAVRKVLLAGLVLFTASSLMCGISDSLPMLITARLLQGTGAAMMGAAAPIICIKYLPPKKLAMGLGILTLGSSMGYAAGPAIGGFIVDALSWHWAFFINIPLGILVLPIMMKVPKDTGSKEIPLDKMGSASFFAMAVSGIFALERCCRPEDSLSCIIATVIFFASLALFIFSERRSEHPLLNLNVFRNRRFNMVLLSLFLVNMIYMGILYLIPFHMHINLGMSSLTSGIFLLLPSLVTLILVVPLSKWSDRTCRRPFAVAGCLALTVALAIWYVAAPDGFIPAILLSLVLLGIVWALSGGAMASRVVEEISDESREIGSSVMMEAIYVGCAVGTALYAMLFVLFTGSGNTSFSDLPPGTFLEGFMFTLAVSVALGVVATLMSVAVRDRPRL